ncbi:MAG: hypothetical protein HLUCCA01_09005 [Bacteroidetes bacterium HLUCCA01]|nr:MAG: hypothetical protein HLUCCA01_09005 [Bacteroidetes bacterium HLUCCA01]
MKFALIEGKRTEATKGAKGSCPSCGSELIARCGELKVNHWAHKSIRKCDSWWEKETEWHRSWKAHYPNDWQEIVMSDEITGEKHIADVRTIHNLVIEFQHSHIKTQERISREKFYKNLIWIVDGTRLQRDYPRFLRSFESFRQVQEGVFIVDFPDEVFPKSWLKSTVPVVFDFHGFSANGHDEIKNTLWCLLPQQQKTQAVVIGLKRSAFVKITHNHEKLFITKNKPEQQQPLTSLTSSRNIQRRGPLIDYIEKRQSSNQHRTRKGKRK